MKTTITEETIRNHVGEQSFKRGQQYYRNNSISNQRRQGSVLKARCTGSYRNAYQIQVKLGRTKAISSARCSCPVGSGGYCKHVAALLLTWLHTPDTFHLVQRTDDALEVRSKAELITLIKHMLKRQPDLELLLETPLPGAKVPNLPVRPDIYYRQAHDAIMNINEAETSVSLSETLLTIKEIGDGFKRQRDFSSAAAAYEGLIRAISDTYLLGYDEEGDVDMIMEDCVEESQKCFVKLSKSLQREDILHTLLIAYKCDAEYCGNLGDSIPNFVNTHTTNEECQMIVDWLQKKVKEQTDPYHQEIYESFLSKLDKNKI